MNLKRLRRGVVALALFALMGGGVVAITAPALAALPNDKQQQRNVLRFDIAENGRRFMPDETPVHSDGKPAYGAEFVTEGYIYPMGTLTCTSERCNGVNPDGSPEFPDKVIGRWTCSGWHVGDGAHTTTGPIVITTQHYDIGDKAGSQSIVTYGFELADLNAPLSRAVIGGTGKYRNARGEQTQTLLGLTHPDLPNFGVVLRVEIETR